MRATLRLALASALLALSAPAAAASDFDAAAAWQRFLAEGPEDAYASIGPANRAYANGEIDADRCRDGAGDLAKAAETVPVSAFVQYVAFRCAEATGDEDAAAAYHARFTALAAHALAQASDDWNARPIRVMSAQDIGVIVRAAGMEPLHEVRRFDSRRHMVVRLVAWDPKAKRERFFAYDYIDAMLALNRGQPNVRYASFRRDFIASVVRSLAQRGVFPVRDAQAEAAASALPDGEARVRELRPLAVEGGYRSLYGWVEACAEMPFEHCGGDLVDTLLDHAEEGAATPTLLLALAYGHGAGVPRDEKMAAQLVDRAETRLQGGRAAVEYARDLLSLDADAKAWPAWLAERLERGAAGGNPEAALLLAIFDLDSDDPAAVAAARDRLRPAAAKGHVGSLGRLGASYDDAEDYAAALPFLRKAAEAGDDDAQERLGRMYLYGQGVPEDEKEAVRWLELAAHGGDALASRRLGHYASWKGDRAAALEWYRSGAYDGDADSKIAFANYLAAGVPGTEADPARARRVLAEMDHPEARRLLASALIHEEPKDPARARALLEQDPEDPESVAMLAVGLAEGLFGKADRAAAEALLAPGIAKLEPMASSAWATWLYHEGGPSRAEAFDLWKRIAAALPADDTDEANVRNNYAWALCTGRDVPAADRAEGLRQMRLLGDEDDLQLSWRDTVAACHAAVGDYARAAEMQRAVVADMERLAPDDESVAGMRERLAAFERREAWIAPEPADEKE